MRYGFIHRSHIFGTWPEIIASPITAKAKVGQSDIVSEIVCETAIGRVFRIHICCYNETVQVNYA